MLMAIAAEPAKLFGNKRGGEAAALHVLVIFGADLASAVCSAGACAQWLYQARCNVDDTGTDLSRWGDLVAHSGYGLTDGTIRLSLTWKPILGLPSLVVHENAFCCLPPPDCDEAEDAEGAGGTEACGDEDDEVISAVSPN